MVPTKTRGKGKPSPQSSGPHAHSIPTRRPILSGSEPLFCASAGLFSRGCILWPKPRHGKRSEEGQTEDWRLQLIDGRKAFAPRGSVKNEHEQPAKLNGEPYEQGAFRCRGRCSKTRLLPWRMRLVFRAWYPPLTPVENSTDDKRKPHVLSMAVLYTPARGCRRRRTAWARAGCRASAGPACKSARSRFVCRVALAACPCCGFVALCSLHCLRAMSKGRGGSDETSRLAAVAGGEGGMRTRARGGRERRGGRLRPTARRSTCAAGAWSRR